MAALYAQAFKVVINPFVVETTAAKAAAAVQAAEILGSGGGLIFLMLILSILAQRVDVVGQLMSMCCTRNKASSLNWTKFDLLFGTNHPVPEGGAVQNRVTAFGGMLTLTCITTVLVLSAQLAVTNLAPTYKTSISTEAPPWAPRGTFRLTVLMYGTCTNTEVPASNVCAATLQAQSSNDWSGTLNSTCTGLSATGDMCTLIWECNDCKYTAFDDARVQLRLPSRSWGSILQYQFEVPRFTSSADDATPADALPPFTVTGTILTPGFENATAMRGLVTQVPILLTPFTIVQPAMTRVTYQPVQRSVAFGERTSLQTFDFYSTKTFAVDFVMKENSFTIAKCVFICLSTRCLLSFRQLVVDDSIVAPFLFWITCQCTRNSQQAKQSRRVCSACAHRLARRLGDWRLRQGERGARGQSRNQIRVGRARRQARRDSKPDRESD